jgi:FAD:protein FMN transferase
MRRHTFQAMGCDVLVVGASVDECEAIESLFVEREGVFSRFRPDSELSSVNAAAGTAVQVSREFADMLQLALQAARETGGLVRPTLGAELEIAGYDTDFSLLRQDGHVGASARVRTGRERAARLYGRTVVFPADVRLDLNGVVKGKTVDDALALLSGEGFVSAGGDLAVRGSLVASLPRGGTVRLLRGALATSGIDRRRWLRGGEVRHHLIDPATGSPSTSPWEQVTVCGRTCLGADVAAKAGFLLGTSGPGWLDAQGLPGRFVAHDGTFTVNRAWQQSLARIPTCI